MAIVAIKIPQLGEGLQEARLLEFLKKPGDTVRKDEPIYEMETDKAVVEVESPYEGTLVAWSAEADSVLPIGTEIGTMEVAAGTQEMSGGHGPAPAANTPAPVAAPQPQTVAAAPVVSGPVPSAPAVAAPPVAPVESSPALSVQQHIAANGAGIPPRTRRFLREKGLMHVAGQIPAKGRRLLPDDVEAFIANGGVASANAVGVSSQNASRSRSGDASSYMERPLNSAQRTLNFRMARGAQVVLPAVLETDIDWTAIQAVRDRVRETGGPTGFAMLAWCIAQAMQQHPPFRSTLSADGNTLRTFNYANMGIAVSLADDVLLTAVVRNADALSKRQFFESLSSRIQEARNGRDQVDATTTVTVSNIGTAGMRVGIPVVVTPAVATVALGAVRDEPVPIRNGFEFKKMVSLTMAFDHRVVNGIGAANFLNTIRSLAAEFTLDDMTA